MKKEQQKEVVEEKIEDQIQKLINTQMEEIKEQTKKDKITITLDKIVSLNIIEFRLDISIPKEKSQENYEFLLEINLIYNKIKNGIFKKEEFNLKQIINNLKLFIDNLPNNLKNSKNLGKFYLTEEYDIIFIKSLKFLTSIPCRHVEFVKGRKITTPCLCCIGDEMFCLYEYGNLSNKYLTNDEYKFTLVFYASFDSLIKFNKLLEGSAITSYWKKRTGKDYYYLKLESDIDKDMNKIIDLLIEKMKQSGVKLDIVEKKYGEVPDINIKEIEQKISSLEVELAKNGNKELFNNLLTTYEQAIVYYSAINDSQYVTYNARVKELLKSEKYANYLS